MVVRLPIQRLQHATDLPLPAYQTEGSAGLDLCADTFDYGDGAVGYSCELLPGQRVLAMTGLHIAIPEGYVGLVCPRSGLALHHGITLLNSPGVIDADFRGEVGVLLVNQGRKPFICESGMRVAQLVITPYARAEVVEVRELPPTSRGKGGFGSTGIRLALVKVSIFIPILVWVRPARVASITRAVARNRACASGREVERLAPMAKIRWQDVRLWYRDGQEVKNNDVRTAYLRELRSEGDIAGAFLVDPSKAGADEKLPDGTHVLDAGPKVDDIDWTDFPAAKEQPASLDTSDGSKPAAGFDPSSLRLTKPPAGRAARSSARPGE